MAEVRTSLRLARPAEISALVRIAADADEQVLDFIALALASQRAALPIPPIVRGFPTRRDDSTRS